MKKNKGESKSVRFKKQKFSRIMQEKLVLIFVFTILAFVVLIGQVTHINATRGEDYTRVVLRHQANNRRNIPFVRGDILDRNGVVLATNVRVYNVILDVAVMSSREEFIEPTLNALEEVFDLDPDMIRGIMEERPHSSFERLMFGIELSEWRQFDEFVENSEDGHLIHGVWAEEDSRRIYPHGSLASSLIGFCGTGNVGAFGIEDYYNSVLNGIDGREYGSFGVQLGVERAIQPPQNGDTVVSTIDVAIQSIVEEHILEFNQSHADGPREGESGSRNTAVLVMNPNNGEIIAMANYPSFDLNNPNDLSHIFTQQQLGMMNDDALTDARNRLWRNFVIASPFEPGSTVKPFTVAAALESGALQGDEYFYCGGMLHVGGFDIHCIRQTAHGRMSLSDVMAVSCNVASMSIAMEVGVPAFTHYQEVFGFGQFTGIDLPGEADTSGVIYTYENMMITDLATNAFGQNFEVTMLQMGVAFSSLINGGNLYAPRVVRQIQDENGRVLETHSPVLLRRTISESTWEANQEHLLAVMTRGTGIQAGVPGYEIGGKTGTAEKLPRDQGNYLLSFIGFAPLEAPEVLIFVVIDEPNVYNQTDSDLVRGLSSRIMADIFPLLEIPMIEGFEPVDVESDELEYWSGEQVSYYGESPAFTEGAYY